MTTRTGLGAALILAMAGGALAGGSHDDGHGRGHAEQAETGGAEHGHGAGHARDAAIGHPAAAAEADRVIAVTMTDFDFRPTRIEVAAGETVLFEIENAGSVEHEFGIGTPAMHAAHREEMMKMAEGHHMDHDDPGTLLLEPGRSGQVAWTFGQAGTLQVACNVPGHYEAGMKRPIEVRPRG